MDKTKKVQDERLYDMYVWRGEYCGVCSALGRSREFIDRRAQQYLCTNHLNLYYKEVEAIKSDRAEYPPGMNKNTQRVYLEDEVIWMKLRILEALVDGRHITQEKALEQMTAIIDLYNQGCMTPEEYRQWSRQLEQERKQKMLPRTRLY